MHCIEKVKYEIKRQTTSISCVVKTQVFDDTLNDCIAMCCIIHGPLIVLRPLVKFNMIVNNFVIMLVLITDFPRYLRPIVFFNGSTIEFLHQKTMQGDC